MVQNMVDYLKKIEKPLIAKALIRLTWGCCLEIDVTPKLGSELTK